MPERHIGCFGAAFSQKPPCKADENTLAVRHFFLLPPCGRAYVYLISYTWQWCAVSQKAVDNANCCRQQDKIGHGVHSICVRGFKAELFHLSYFHNTEMQSCVPRIRGGSECQWMIPVKSGQCFVPVS